MDVNVVEDQFRYRVLDPRPASRAAELEFLASTPTLGVEVTIAELAQACQLGNIDPQHGGGDAARGDADTSAVEAALTWPLPPAGTVLATVRPDADAYAAMAVLVIRAAEEGSHAWLAPRARLIGEADRTAPQEDGGGVTSLAALRAACLATRDAAEGVRIAHQWLRTGEFAGMAEWQARVAVEREETAAVAASVISVSGGRIAVVESTSRYAVAAAYRHADVVVAVNPAFRRPGAGPDEQPHRKITICQARAGLLDLPGALGELAAAEPGWGGSPMIGGSPQGVATAIPTADVVAVVERHLTS